MNATAENVKPDAVDPQVLDAMYGDPLRAPTEYERAILAGLQRLPSVYGGTVDPAVVAHRRSRNKAARRSRRINRIGGQR